MHCASRKCIGNCADFRAPLPALVRALLRSPPALRPALPRALRALSLPLNRRSGSGPPGSPASISPSLIPQIRPSLPPGAALGSTPHASVMLVVPCAAMACPMGTIGASGRLVLVGSSVCSGEPWPSYWNRFCFFGTVLWRTVQIGPGFSGEPSIRPRGSLENRPIPGHIGPSRTEFSVPAGPKHARFRSPTRRILERGMARRGPNATNPWVRIPQDDRRRFPHRRFGNDL